MPAYSPQDASSACPGDGARHSDIGDQMHLPCSPQDAALAHLRQYALEHFSSAARASPAITNTRLAQRIFSACPRYDASCSAGVPVTRGRGA